MSGFNLVVAIIALIAIVLHWWFSSKKIVERPNLSQKLIRVIAIMAIASLVIGVRELFFRSPQAFPEWKNGIFVARIKGDSSNSIQQDLVTKLNAELKKEIILLGVEAKSLPFKITETMGHKEARRMGKKYNAKLVIWGSRESDSENGVVRLHITVISEEYESTKVTSQPFKAQVIEEIKLPPASAKNPILLIHFILAKSYFDQYEFENAKVKFEKCLNQPQKDIAYENSIRFWLAMTYVNLGRFRGETEYMERAIYLYQGFFDTWTEQDFPIDWAATQHNLGIAYSELPTGDREENIKRAIECYEDALRVRTEQDFPLDWAATQYNLGVAYSELPISEQRENLQKAIQCFRNALRIWTEEKYPYDYETTQQSLTIAIKKLTEKIIKD